MGIFGLTSWCREKKDSASERVNLTEFSRTELLEGRSRPVLFVDGFGLLYDVFGKVLPGWQWALGGEYAAFDLALKNWLERLTKGGVSICICFDPSRGTESEHEIHKGRKEYEMEKRFKERCLAFAKVILAGIDYTRESVVHCEQVKADVRFRVMSKFGNSP
jgi:hypothetical protein